MCAMSTKWSELFPTRLTQVIFLCYMCLFICQGIFVTASQEPNNSYKYNTITVVLLTEILKLIISTVLYCRTNNLKSLAYDVRKDIRVLLLYFVPAFLYCLYNNLAFVNLSRFDPTTYYLLLQLRVAATGILFQVIFKKYLSRRQWFSLILLTIGCMIKQLDLSVFYANKNLNSDGEPGVDKYLSSSSKNTSGFDLSISAFLMLSQTLFSCLAGVYNEYLLKDVGSEVNIYVQNVFMYLDSIICNVAILIIRGELMDAFTTESLLVLLRFSIVIIIINNAAIGIVTSFFLKYMNSILKTFASALELLFTAILCYFLFNIPIYMNTALSIIVVSYAIYLYTQSPVVNVVKRLHFDSFRSTQQSEQQQNLISQNDNVV